ncbi:MAG: HlyD family efflux transporter periplasmic adaptor subunit [Limnohabitans sp.]
MTQNPSTPQLADLPLKRKRNTRLAAFVGGVLLIAAAATAYWSLYVSHFISTDNAYTMVEIAQITPSVGGTVLEVQAKDTQAVNRGDVLVVIDPTDARLALAQASAELDRSVRRVASYQANDERLAAQLAATQSDLDRAKVDLQRREALAASGSVSGDELTRARNAHSAAQANLRAAQAAKDANATLIKGTQPDTHPEVLAAKARLDQAKVDLDRTTVKAPVDGVVVKRQVQLGQRVQPGMPLMAVVPVQDMYVDANFKEVQLSQVRIGQPVRLHADLYGKDVSFQGVVEGFSASSGSALSAIPAQNATGNWIKVVQRLPVRIKLDATELQAHPLKVGLSMHAEIDTRGGAR